MDLGRARIQGDCMICPMRPERLDQIDDKLLTELCSDNCPEAQVLEFKRALPDRSDKGHAEFLKDVCAFANADGGDLVYGIAEKDARASSLAPIAKRWLRSYCTSARIVRRASSVYAQWPLAICHSQWNAYFRPCATVRHFSRR
jgi:hypothetical protein